MSLQSRLAALITAIGADIKALQSPKSQKVGYPDNNVDEASRMEWENVGGAWVAKIQAHKAPTTPNRNVLEITSRVQTNGETAALTLTAEEYGSVVGSEYFNGDRTSIELNQVDSASSQALGTGTIMVRAGNKSKYLHTSSGYSDFEALKETRLSPTNALVLSGAGPFDGLVRHVLADPTNGVWWTFRCREFEPDGSTPNPSAYKWELVGGGWLYKKVGTNATRTSSNVNFEDSAAGVLQYITPWAGDWEVEIGCSSYWNSTAGGYAAIAAGIGAFTAVNNDRMRAVFGAAAGHTDYSPQGKVTPFTGLASGSDIRVRISRRAAVGTANIQDPMWMRVRPIRGG